MTQSHGVRPPSTLHGDTVSPLQYLHGNHLSMAVGMGVVLKSRLALAVFDFKELGQRAGRKGRSGDRES